MRITCAISLGELIDKLTILEIKAEKISDHDKLTHVENERRVLQETLDQLRLSDYQLLMQELKNINMKLWEIEDSLRELENEKNFGENFIDLARQVYLTNDKRFLLKKSINEKFGSKLQEVKSYKKY